ncbi:C39 family peptidase [Planosporangium sp. 12N6]|uniref:C39 family peptidase n=1 Tax=Planosporangium spinosum TaxID=3402278 RepID=UPI003CF4EB7A
MKPLRTRTRFRHAAPSGISRLALVSAGVLAVAATSGILISESSGQATSKTSTNVALVDTTTRDGGAERADRSQSRTQAPAQSSAPARTQARASAQAPVQAQAPAQTQAPAQAQAPESAQAQAQAQAPAAPSAAPTATPAPAPPVAKELDYQYQSQPNYYYCGPASTRIVLTVRGKTPSQDEVARLLGTDTGGTDSAVDTTRVLNSVLGTDFYQTRSIPGPAATPAQMDQLQADVVHAVSNGYGVVANVVGSATDTNGNWHSYGGGHYVAIVGYNDEGRAVKIADPANPSASSYWVTTINMAKWMVNRGYSY